MNWQTLSPEAKREILAKMSKEDINNIKSLREKFNGVVVKIKLTIQK